MYDVYAQETILAPNLEKCRSFVVFADYGFIEIF